MNQQQELRNSQTGIQGTLELILDRLTNLERAPNRRNGDQPLGDGLLPIPWQENRNNRGNMVPIPPPKWELPSFDGQEPKVWIRTCGGSPKGKRNIKHQLAHNRRNNRVDMSMDQITAEKVHNLIEVDQPLDLFNFEIQAFSKASTIDKIAQEEISAGVCSPIEDQREKNNWGTVENMKETEGNSVVTKERGAENNKEQPIVISNSCMGGTIWDMEEAMPIATEHVSQITEKGEITSAWVRQNIIKLGKMFGVDFKGHEGKTMELLMQIDACRQAKKIEASPEIRKTRLQDAN